MSDKTDKPFYLTAAAADALIGTTGTVRAPGKPAWPGSFRLVSYALDPDDDNRVATVKLESLAVVAEQPVRDVKGVVMKVVPAHPAEVAPSIPARWFKPDQPEPTQDDASIDPKPSLPSTAGAAAPKK